MAHPNIVSNLIHAWREYHGRPPRVAEYRVGEIVDELHECGATSSEGDDLCFERITEEDAAPRSLMKHGPTVSLVVRLEGGEVASGFVLHTFLTAAERDEYAKNLSALTGWPVDDGA